MPRRHTESLTAAPLDGKASPSTSQFLRRYRVVAETPATAAARGVVVVVNRLTDPLLVSLLRAKSPRKRATQVQVVKLWGISRCQLSVPKKKFLPLPNLFDSIQIVARDSRRPYSIFPPTPTDGRNKFLVIIFFLSRVLCVSNYNFVVGGFLVVLTRVRAVKVLLYVCMRGC